MQDKLIARAKELLAEGKVQKVVGWKKGLFEDDITPAVFNSAEELDKDFVFNKFCKANLSKYLVKITREIEVAKSTTRMNNTMAKQRDPNAQDKPIPQATVLVFLKPSDTYSFTQLLKENRITRGDVYAIGVPCQDTLDGGEVCDNCKNKKPVSCDELIGIEADVEAVESTRMAEVEKLEVLHVPAKNVYSTTTSFILHRRLLKLTLKKASSILSVHGTLPAAVQTVVNVHAFVHSTSHCIF